jgi:hypothetical protein
MGRMRRMGRRRQTALPGPNVAGAPAAQPQRRARARMGLTACPAQHLARRVAAGERALRTRIPVCVRTRRARKRQRQREDPAAARQHPPALRPGRGSDRSTVCANSKKSWVSGVSIGVRFGDGNCAAAVSSVSKAQRRREGGPAGRQSELGSTQRRA